MAINPIRSIQALDAPAQQGLKRKFEQLNSSEPTWAFDPVLKRARLIGPPSEIQELMFSQSNALMRLRPGLKKHRDEFVIVEVKVQISPKNTISFQIPKWALLKLSPYFKRELSQGMIEGNTGRILWVGPGIQKNIHPQAAAQLIQFAYAKFGLIDAESGLSLQDLKAKFHDDFPVILIDIMRLAFFFEMDDLQKECFEFIQEEIKFDVRTFRLYLSMAISLPEGAMPALKKVIQAIAKDDLKLRLGLYPELSALFEADYPESSKEEVASYRRFLQEIFSEIVPGNLANRDVSYEPIEICKCLVRVFPQFDFPKRLMEKINAIAFERPEYNTIPEVFYVCWLCRHSIRNKIFDGVKQESEATFRKSLPDERPRAEGKLLEYKLFCEALDEDSMPLEYIVSDFPENILARILLYWGFGFINMLDSALLINPDYIDGLELRVRHLQTTGNMDDAISDLSRAFQLTKDSRFLYARGESYRRQGNPVAALKDFELWEKDAKNYPFHKPFEFLARADCHLQLGDKQLAIQCMNQGLLAAKAIGPIMNPTFKNFAFETAQRMDCRIEDWRVVQNPEET